MFMPEKQRDDTRRDEANSQRDRNGNGSTSGKRWALLSIVAVTLAAAIAVVTGFLMPLDEPPEAHEPPSQATLPNPNPTIQIPVYPVEISAEQVRTELLELAASLYEEFPNAPDALHVVAVLYADLQRTQKAEEIWRKCIQLVSDQAGPYLGLATTAMELGKHEEALEILQRASAAGCSAPDLSYETAVALTKLGRLEEARDVLREGTEDYPQAAENWLQLGQIQIQLGQFVEAEESLLRAIAEGTPTVTVYFSLATACARQGKTEQAAKYRQEFSEQKAEQEEGKNSPFQIRYDSELRRIAVATTCRAGSIYDFHGHPDEAERLLLRALEFSPGNARVCGELVRFYRAQGRPADAMLLQHRLTEIEPQKTSHYVNLASLAAQLGNNQLAESALRHVISMRPDLAVGYAGLAHLYLQMGRSDQARWFAEAALKQHAEASDLTLQTYVVLAQACRQLGDQAGAKAAEQMAAKLASADTQ